MVNSAISSMHITSWDCLPHLSTARRHTSTSHVVISPPPLVAHIFKSIQTARFGVFFFGDGFLAFRSKTPNLHAGVNLTAFLIPHTPWPQTSQLFSVVLCPSTVLISAYRVLCMTNVLRKASEYPSARPDTPHACASTGSSFTPAPFTFPLVARLLHTRRPAIFRMADPRFKLPPAFRTVLCHVVDPLVLIGNTTFASSIFVRRTTGPISPWNSNTTGDLNESPADTFAACNAVRR